MSASARTTGAWVILRPRDLAEFYVGRATFGGHRWSSDPKAAQIFRTRKLAEKVKQSLPYRHLAVTNLAKRVPAPASPS